MRGMSGVEDAARTGIGHLLSFVGTDTIPAIQYAEQYYGANIEKELVGCSVNGNEETPYELNLDSNYSLGVFATGNYTIPDYSNSGYFQIIPDNNSRVILMECIDSTLIINNNMLYCESYFD